MSEPTSTAEILDSKSESVKADSLKGKSFKGQLGGARPGAGHPKGQLTKKKLDQLRIQRAFNQRIMNHADDLFNAQFDLAVGEKVLFVKITERNDKGNVIRVYHDIVTDPQTIIQYLDYEDPDINGESPHDNEHFYYMTTKPANNQALDSLLNRGLGKAPDKLEITHGFFMEKKLTIEVVGDRKDIIDIGDDGQLATDDAEVNTEQEAGPSDPAPESPPSS
jgi:hypothetical protein